MNSLRLQETLEANRYPCGYPAGIQSYDRKAAEGLNKNADHGEFKGALQYYPRSHFHDLQGNVCLKQKKTDKE